MDQAVAGAGARPVRFGHVGFDRSVPGLIGIAVKGFLLGLVTFGIYRFWYMTELRRYFWGRTIVAGSPAEYTGHGRELFLGFLVALVVLVPVYVGLFLVGVVHPALAPFTAPISFVLLFLLGQYALFRGRRYRASRTLWRGIRCGQDGSALVYVLMATGWWAVTILTLGLAFPWMRAGLERYRINHTLIGQGRMRSRASGRSIVGPWLVLYAAGLLPPLVAGLALVAANGFAFPLDLFVADPASEDGSMKMNPAYESTPVQVAAVLALVAALTALPLAFLLLPYYRARETRAFLNAASLGPARLTSTLKARDFYLPYIVYFALIGAFATILGLVVFGTSVLIQVANAGDAVVVVLALGAGLLYLGSLLLFAVLYLRVVTVRLWHAVAASTGILDADALDEVAASQRRAGSGLNEGLADALDVGGALEIGF